MAIALATIVAQHAFNLDPEIEIVLDYADSLICLGFMLDFLVAFWRTPRRWHYLVTWGWLDLVSAIPTFEIARWGRLARIARIARILRGVRAMRLLTSTVLAKRDRRAAQSGRAPIIAAAVLRSRACICAA